MPIWMQWIQWLSLFSFANRECLEDLQNRQREQRFAMLHHLQRTMDPLIAAQVYNNQHSTLYRLPDELLLLVLRSLGRDPVALCCLRRVSRRFRQLVNEPSVRRYIPMSCFNRGFESPHTMACKDKQQLRRHLQTDGMCDKCKLWCNVPVRGWSRKVTQSFNSCKQRWIPCRCKFECDLYSRHGPQFHCSACNMHHIDSAFSRASFSLDRRTERRCLGYEGRIRLCRHVGIGWSAVEDHIAKWRTGKLTTWEAWLDDFNIECRHPSHDTGCSYGGAPTWPRARLRNRKWHGEPDTVVLSLEWSAHSGDTDAFRWTAAGRPFASDLRTLFRKFRQQGPVEALTPMYPSGDLLEMVCFDPNKCRCLHYQGNKQGDLEKWDMADGPQQGPKSFLCHDCPVDHRFSPGYRRGLTWAIWMCQHWPKGPLAAPCLITTYRYRVKVCDKGILTDTGNPRAYPPHGWFHALDPDACPRPPGHLLPLCKERHCMNHYKRPRTYNHALQPVALYTPCDCNETASGKRPRK
ncbi:hypothetical protein BT67DRAFT_75097 [Trichocladium antarcticum]|uniref:F-box domain-containing protein n=1 Tax=Trichocladium antarcticum TaxID=1450529 RepID=A0AAN6UH73_9PEZI|nr:hypothetical protein BT67DRAFT_75097 [Trichocladium antarcticum]